MQKIIISFTVVFVAFILFVIYIANTGQGGIFALYLNNIPYADKFGHFTLFGLLALALNLSSKMKSIPIGPTRVYYGTLIVSFFAVLEELSQHFIDTRTLDGGDLLADAIGITLFTYCTYYIQNKHWLDDVT